MKALKLNLMSHYFLTPNNKILPYYDKIRITWYRIFIARVFQSFNFSYFCFYSFKWLQRDSNLQTLSSYTNTQRLSQTDLNGRAVFWELICYYHATNTIWLTVCLQTKWLWIRIPLQSLKCQVSRLFRARSSLIYRQL